MTNTDWSDLKFVVDQLNHEFKYSTDQCCQIMNKVHRFVNFLSSKWTFYEHEKFVNFLWTFYGFINNFVNFNLFVSLTF